MAHYEEIPFLNPDEFLRAVALSSEYNAPHDRYSWMFRGQGNTKPLLPSAWRPKELGRFKALEWPLDDYEDLVRAEFEIVRRFFLLADRRGLALPDDSRELRRQIKARRPPSISHWPREWESVVALAQHHGLPTRLLDWSWEPKVAAYFAATNAKKEKKEIVVFALRSAACHQEGQGFQVQFSSGELDQVTAAGADNENLRAQEGVFTVWRPWEMSFPQPFEPLEEIIKAAKVEDDSSLALLRRFTLPAQHAPDLLYRLKQEGVSGSSVWPGYRGVADEIKQDFLKPVIEPD